MTSEVEERPRVVIALYGGLGVNGLTKKAQNPNFAEFLAFWGLFGIGSANLSQKDPSFGKLGHVINPLNPRAFCKKRGFLDILVLSRLNLGQITFNAVKNALASQQLGFLATSIAMCDVLSRACAEIKILR